MDQKSNWRLLSKRNILGVVLVAGIGAGLYLGDFWKGLGGGNSLGIGLGDGTSSSTSKSATGDKDSTGTIKATTHDDSEANPEKTAAVPLNAPHVVKVVIADRSYFLRATDGDEAIDLKQLIDAVKSATGDQDGIRIRIYRKQTSRTSTELALRDALSEAGITEEQIVWIAQPIE